MVRTDRKSKAGKLASCVMSAGLTDTIVAIEMTGIYHKPAQRAFRQAAFDSHIVHPFASSHQRWPLHPHENTDEHDLKAIFRVVVNGYGLAKLPVGEMYASVSSQIPP